MPMENLQIPRTEVPVALQGTIETFALPDVMQLLASTSKTGRLHLEGSRGTGSIWMDSGQIVGGEASSAPHADGAVEVVFELLRFKDGDFVFEADETTGSPTDPSDVAATLADAEAMLEEWKTVEAVVPSLEAWVTLSPSLSGAEVTIDDKTWEMIVAIAGGTSVARLGEEFSLGEMPISKRVKSLIEAGLGEIGDPPADAQAAVTTLRDVSSSPVPSETVEEPAEVETAEPDVFASHDDVIVDTSGVGAEVGVAHDEDLFDPNALVIEHEPVEVAGDVEVEMAGTAGAASIESSPTDAAEIARQLANLSPKAARAVAAAARATTEEERELALAEVDDDEESINRDLLIKFLGSVNG